MVTAEIPYRENNKQRKPEKSSTALRNWAVIESIAGGDLGKTESVQRKVQLLQTTWPSIQEETPTDKTRES